jgi:acetyltransferase-like isoleucine patch superfamily enzyme
MVKRNIKNILLWFIKAIKLPQLITDVQTQQKKAAFNAMVTNNGATFYPEAEVINISGDKAKIVIGNNTHIRAELLVYAYAKILRIGNDCYVGKGSVIRAGQEIIIGNNVLIAHNVNIFDTDSHELAHLERSESYKQLLMHGHPGIKGNIAVAPVIIEDYAWINFNVIILKGVTIGKGAIVAAGSVVTKNVAPFTLVAGNPAKFIKQLN